MYTRLHKDLKLPTIEDIRSITVPDAALPTAFCALKRTPWTRDTLIRSTLKKMDISTKGAGNHRLCIRSVTHILEEWTALRKGKTDTPE